MSKATRSLLLPQRLPGALHPPPGKGTRTAAPCRRLPSCATILGKCCSRSATASVVTRGGDPQHPKKDRDQPVGWLRIPHPSRTATSVAKLRLSAPACQTFLPPPATFPTRSELTPIPRFALFLAANPASDLQIHGNRERRREFLRTALALGHAFFFAAMKSNSFRLRGKENHPGKPQVNLMRRP